jgi:uncharacterized protein (DUF4415 family)
MEDHTVDYAPSRPTLGVTFWREAAPVYPSRSRRLTRIRIDGEVLDWFGVHRDDPHFGVNAVLRGYVEDRKKNG